MPRLEHSRSGAFHVITSPDVPGLYVADVDRSVAEARVGPTIDALARMAARKANELRVRTHAVSE